MCPIRCKLGVYEDVRWKRIFCKAPEIVVVSNDPGTHKFESCRSRIFQTGQLEWAA